MSRTMRTLVALILAVSPLLAGENAAVVESARPVPVVATVEVVVVGGTTWGVDAAVAAARAGASVFLISSHTYLGEDRTGTLRWWDGAGGFSTPLEIKRRLDDALESAKVEFLLSSFATDLIRDGSGRICGVVMANRAGRQAVLAKAVVDATPEALVHRLAGVAMPALPSTAEWRVIGASAKAGAQVQPLPEEITTVSGKKGPGVRGLICQIHTLTLPLADGSWAARAQAEQSARDQTYDEQQLYASEVPGWPPVAVPASVAGIHRAVEDAAKVGEVAAAAARKLPAIQDAAVVRPPVGSAPVAGEVKELLAGIRTLGDGSTVSQPAGALPVLGRYEVVVVGGGTSGACAGIGAARQQARTLVIEYLHGLGGVGTEGMIGKYYHGNRIGFTQDIPQNPLEVRKEWYRRELRQAGADIWFGCLGCGALVTNGRITGVVVATPYGRGVVLAQTVVDSTGSSDTAIAAGAAYSFIDASDVAVQGTGLPARGLGASYTNTDFTFADDSDPWNLRRLFVAGRRAGGGFDAGQLIDTRERRRIVGDITLDPLDLINGRTWPDSIVQCKSNFDSHGYTVHPYFTLVPPGRDGITAFVPYRALIPQGLDGLLVTGLGISAHRDAVPPIRMQPDLHNQGYAAGVAAAMVAQAGGTLRSLDLKRLQRHLVEIGNLPASVLGDGDSFPPPAAAVAAAVQSLVENGTGADLVMWHPQVALPLLKADYAKASGPAKLVCAQVLAFLGDPTGVDALLEAVTSAETWDPGWKFRGMGQYGASRSPLDALIQALGATRDRRAVPALIAKVELLNDTSEFSHIRAVAIALESTADPSAAAALAGALGRLKGRREDRDFALREITLARALLRCGDRDGTGRRILEDYTRDARGPFARHALAVLAAGESP